MTFEFYFLLGEEQLKDGNYEKALYYFDEAIRINDNFAWPWNSKGNLFNEKKEYNNALYCFDEAIRRDDSFAYPWYGKGTVYHKLNDFEQALFCYSEAIRRYENFANPWNGKGNVYYVLKDYRKALQCFDEAICKDDNFAPPWHGKGTIYHELNDLEQARFCYYEAIRRDENFANPWNDLGTVYKVLEDYEKAIFCYSEAIRIDDTFAFPWNGKGDVYYELKDYEQALYYYINATRRNEKYAFPWNGMGNVYYKLKDYEMALDHYDQAILKDESFAYPWNGKGNVYHESAEFELAKISYLRAFFLNNNNIYIWNCLLLFSKYPTAPFYTYRIIPRYLDIDEYKKWELLIKTTTEQCQTMQAYIAWLQLTGKKVNSGWHLWLAQVFYFMGDPVKSYEKLNNEVLKENTNDLCAWYYLIKSCQGFDEFTDPFMKEAITVAEQYPFKRSDRTWGIQRQTLSEEEVKQHYYAGLLQYEDKEPALAIECFRAIKDDFLPAAYMLLYLLHQTGCDMQILVKDIYRRERRMPDGEMSYAHGFCPQHLDLDREDFLTPFQHYSHYCEITDAIDLFASLAPKEDELVPIPSSEAKAFWLVWFLEEKDYQRIFKEAREYQLRILTEEIIHDRSLVYDFISGTIPEPSVTAEKVVQSLSNKIGDFLERTYRELLTESSADERERRLGNLITEWPFNKPIYYQRLSAVLFLQDLLTEKQKVYLDFYAHIQNYVRQKPSDVLFAGAKDVFKEVIGKAITPLLESAGGWSGAALSIFLKPLAKGMLAELIIKHLKSGEAPFKTYTDFKEGFRVFIGGEKQRLGEKFEERYPMYEFEEWIG